MIPNVMTNDVTKLQIAITRVDDALCDLLHDIIYFPTSQKRIEYLQNVLNDLRKDVEF